MKLDTKRTLTNLPSQARPVEFSFHMCCPHSAAFLVHKRESDCGRTQSNKCHDTGKEIKIQHFIPQLKLVLKL